MFRNYLKTAIRRLTRNRIYTVINIAGLAAGISVCLLIFIIIRFETSFDGFHAKKDRIYRILTEFHLSGDHGIFYGSAVPAPLPSIIKNDFPELQKTTGIYASGNDQVFVLDEKGQTTKKFKEESGVFAVEPAFFDIFDFPWLSGDPYSSLKEPTSAVLTKETAIKYFGDWKKAVGRMIKLNNMVVLKVTGILATVPPNTDFQFKIILPYRLNGFSPSSDWNTSSDNHNCYVLLPPGESAASFNRKLRLFARKYRPADNKNDLASQPLSRVHYYDSHNHINNFLGRTIAPEVIRTLWIIAAFILIIACVNFINLATAQAVNRAKEIAVRKVIGGNKWQLRTQFLLETFSLVVLSVLLAMVITSLAIGPLGKILEMPLSFEVFRNPGIAMFLLIVTLLITFLAGFYPSIVMSRFNPIKALKSKPEIKTAGAVSLRRSLVVFQFVIAQGLIIATLILVSQMNYFKNGPMGFDKEAVISVPIPWDSAGAAQIDFLRNRLRCIQGVKNVSFNSTPPATADNNWDDFEFDHGAKGKGLYSIFKSVDAEYLKTYQLALVAGRNFSSDTAHEFLITENLAHKLGMSRVEDALNKEINLGNGFIKGPVVGVLKDFHSTGFKDKYSLVLVTPHKAGYHNAGIKLSSAHAGSALKEIEKLWNNAYPDFVFEYHFLDADIGKFYVQENQQAQLYKIFAAIAILLGCLGLYGLASFMANQRVKEIGIRKVLGASVGDIVYLFSREFILLIGIAFLVASPLAWYFMHNWLQDYAFRIHISWWYFVAGGMASVLIALGTISFNAIRTATANPIRSLRTE